jgi:hypothetical protein
MPSSISSFEDVPRREVGLGASVIFLALTVLLLAGLELGARVGVPHLSRIERRAVDEYQAALNCGRQHTAAKQVLFVGNSLMGEGVQFDVLRKRLFPSVDAKRFLIESADARDWYFGLRRIFAAGSRPNAVVLFLNPGQLVSDQLRGDYSAYRLVRPEDLVTAAREGNMSNTSASNFVSAHFSAFFGLRAEIRKWVIGKLFPQFPQLTRMLIRQNQKKPLDKQTLYEKAARRLDEFRRLAQHYGADFTLVVPPSGPGEDPEYARIVERAGRAAGVAVLVPVPPGSLPAEDYSDGFHLNSTGAAIFTRRLADSLGQ